MAWKVFKKSEVLTWKPTSKWRWNYYARDYKEWAKYEVSTAWALNQSNRALQKALRGYERTQSLFIYFETKKGEKITVYKQLKKGRK